MLAPGGRILLQDFAYPKDPRVQKLFVKHFERMTARFEGDPDWETMWARLPDVVRQSPWIDHLQDAMRKSGLVDIEVVEQSWGLAALVTGRKPAA